MSGADVQLIRVDLGDQSIALEVPADPDSLVRAAVARGEPEPEHWAHLWPSARHLARHILSGSLVGPGVRVLEIGCGLGLVGIAAAKRGADAILTDISETALLAAQRNASLNAVAVRTQRLDWSEGAFVSTGDPAWKPDLILGADVLYHADAPEAVGRLICNLGCPALLADPLRAHAQDIESRLRACGLSVWSSPAESGRIIMLQRPEA